MGPNELAEAVGGAMAVVVIGIVIIWLVMKMFKKSK
jgi:hypothetical protein